MKVLDLFSGIGGFSLGLESTGCFETVAFCEKEEFCRRVLKKHWPDVPIWEDIHDVSGFQFRGIDLICGGFPCQPVSLAGKRKGNRDDRWLWPEFFRVIREAQPTWCLIENVPGLRTKHADEVLSDLEGQGYTWWPLVVGAVHAGAPHRRQRVWIVAYSEHRGGRGVEPQWTKRQRDAELTGNGAEGDAPDASSKRRQQECGSSFANEAQYERGSAQHNHQFKRNGESGDAPDTHHQGLEKRQSQPRNARTQFQTLERGGTTADTTSPGRRPQGGSKQTIPESQAKQRSAGRHSLPSGAERWDWSRAPEPVLRGVDDGVPCGLHRTKRLKALGNAVVPQVVAQIGYQIAWSQMLI